MRDRAAREDIDAAHERGAANKSMEAPAAPSLNKQLGTGHGRDENSQARTVNFERATNMPEEVVTIYYDSRTNLIARGIIQDSHRQRREPQPFPARFVPDPPPRW